MSEESELHTPGYWLRHQGFEQPAPYKKPMSEESYAHRSIYCAEVMCHGILMGQSQHEEFEEQVKAARREMGLRWYGMKNGVTPEVLAARSMAAIADLVIPFVLNH